MSIPEFVPTDALLFALLSQGHDHGQMVYDEEQEHALLAEDAAVEHAELAHLIREEIGREYPGLEAVLHEAMWRAWLFGFAQGYACLPKRLPEQGWLWFFKTPARDEDASGGATARSACYPEQDVPWFFRTPAHDEDAPAGATTRREHHRAHFLGRGFPAEGVHDAHWPETHG